MSKVPVPDSITNFIRERTHPHGKVILVLKHNKYYVESSHPEALQTLLKDDVIRSAWVHTQAVDDTIKAATFTTGNAPVEGRLTIHGKRRDDKAMIDTTDYPSSMQVVGADAGDIFYTIYL